MATAYRNDNHFANAVQQKARRAVNAGRARYLHDRPRSVEIQQPNTPPVRHPQGKERRFGSGVFASMPNFRSTVSAEDRCWWELEAQREEERELDRRFEEFRAQERLSAGLDC